MRAIELINFDRIGQEIPPIKRLYGPEPETAYMLTLTYRDTTATAKISYWPPTSPCTALPSIPTGPAALVEQQARQAITAHATSVN